MKQIPLNLTYSKLNNGLQTWIQFAENARSYLVSDTIPKDITNLSQILEYCKPLMIYSAIMLFLMLMTISGVSRATKTEGTFPMLWTMLLQKVSSQKTSGHEKSFKEKENRRMGNLWDSIFALAVSAKIVNESVGAAILFTVSPTMTASLQKMNSSIISTLDSGKVLINSLLPAISDTIVGLEGYLESDIKEFTDLVNVTLINITIVNNLIPIAILLNDSHNNITSLKAKSSIIMASRNTLFTLFGNLNSSFVTTTNSIIDLSTNDHPIGSSGISWKKAAALTLPSNLNNNLGVVISITPPNSDNILNSLNSVNLSIYSNEIMKTAQNVPNNISNTIEASANSVISDVKINLNKVNESIVSSSRDSIQDANKIIDDVDKQIIGIFKTVIFYDGFRNISIMVISGIILLIIFIETTGLTLKNPRITKGCNLTAVLFFVLMYIFGIAVLVVTVVISAGCKNVFVDRNMGPISTLSLKGTLDTAFDFRNECLLNKSAISAISSVGLIDSKNTNITLQTQEKLDAVDFSVISEWNSSNSMSLSDSPANRVNGLTSVNISSFDTSSLDGAISTNIPELVTDLNLLKSTVDTAYTNAAVGDLIFTVNPTVQQQSDALLSYKYQLGNISATLSQLINLLNTDINGNSTFLRNQIVSVKDDAQASISTAQTYQSLYDSVVTKFDDLQIKIQTDLKNNVPEFKKQLIYHASILNTRLEDSLPCYNLANSIFNIEDAVCSSGLSSLDGVWFTCLFVAVIFTLSMPLIIWGSNVLFPSYYMEIWEAKYESQDLRPDKGKKKMEEGDKPEQTNILKSGVYTEEEVYSDPKKRSFFSDKINEFSVNQVGTSTKRGSSFLANAGLTPVRRVSENSTNPSQPSRNEALVQIFESGSADHLNQNHNATGHNDLARDLKGVRNDEINYDMPAPSYTEMYPALNDPEMLISLKETYSAPENIRNSTQSRSQNDNITNGNVENTPLLSQTAKSESVQSYHTHEDQKEIVISDKQPSEIIIGQLIDIEPEITQNQSALEDDKGSEIRELSPLSSNIEMDLRDIESGTSE